MIKQQFHFSCHIQRALCIFRQSIPRDLFHPCDEMRFICHWYAKDVLSLLNTDDEYSTKSYARYLHLSVDECMRMNDCTYCMNNPPITAINCWIHQKHWNSLYPFTHSPCITLMMRGNVTRPRKMNIEHSNKIEREREWVKGREREIKPVGRQADPTIDKKGTNTPEIIINY